MAGERPGHDSRPLKDDIAMTGHPYENENCSAARALELIEERWSLLILRDALFRGITRFSDFQRNLGLASTVLVRRLDTFVAAGIMERRRYGTHGRCEYVPSAKGLDFKPVVIALTAWGDRWAAPHEPPVVFEHEGCGGRVEQQLCCSNCGSVPKLTEIVARAVNTSGAMRRGAVISSRAADVAVTK